MTLYFILSLTLLSTIAFCAPTQIKKPSSRQAGIVYAIHASEPDVITNDKEGLSLRVTRELSIEASYTIVFTAVKAEELNSNDSEFIRTLSFSERTRYFALKANYKGGIRIPFLEFIGINLYETVSLRDMEAVAARDSNYNAKATAAKRILEAAQTTITESSGTLSIKPIGIAKSSASAGAGNFAVARLFLRDGRLISVFAPLSADHDISERKPAGDISLFDFSR